MIHFFVSIGAPAPLYAPWRDNYSSQNQKSTITHNCPFCTKITDNQDDKHFVLARYKHHVVILNLFPYTRGHILIIPYKHCACLTELEPEAEIELAQLIHKSIIILRREVKCDGFNLGLNIGKIAGASIPDHLHYHIVPRNEDKDVSFLQTIAGVQEMPYSLPNLYRILKPHFDAVSLD